MRIKYGLHEKHHTTYECGSCSAIVRDMAAHTRWHERIVAMFPGTPLHDCAKDGCTLPGIVMLTTTGFGAQEETWRCPMHHQEMVEYLARRTAEQRSTRRVTESGGPSDAAT